MKTRKSPGTATALSARNPDLWGPSPDSIGGRIVNALPRNEYESQGGTIARVYANSANSSRRMGLVALRHEEQGWTVQKFLSPSEMLMSGRAQRQHLAKKRSCLNDEELRNQARARGLRLLGEFPLVWLLMLPGIPRNQFDSDGLPQQWQTSRRSEANSDKPGVP